MSACVVCVSPIAPPLNKYHVERRNRVVCETFFLFYTKRRVYNASAVRMVFVCDPLRPAFYFRCVFCIVRRVIT